MKPPAKTEIDELAELLRVLGHSARLRIVTLLANSEYSVGEIEKLCGIPQPGLSQQLGVLRQAELVQTRRDGKLVHYRLNPSKIEEICAGIGWMESAKRALPSETASTERRRKFGSGASFAKIVQ